MSKARELVAALAAEGTLESRGQFTLDKAKAREKLQKFQLAEPERYVVLLAEAALMGGATFLEVDIDGDDVREISLCGRPSALAADPSSVVVVCDDDQ